MFPLSFCPGLPNGRRLEKRHLTPVNLLFKSLFSLFQPEYKVADPICTFLFSVFVLCTTVTILRDVFRILMEGASPGAPLIWKTI